ncbi:glycosyltransferase [Henriciella barbarensis]|uniref:Glycosyltransferase n=1 Tax=Henriciella barbarensis TaxID=86342 RepID=A0A399QQL0_9PROT|nr:glycosyltransferase [Henriciella barbarensis]RIJ20465.1 glycosyltransferase [Henriciella barbarensis]
MTTEPSDKPSSEDHVLRGEDYARIGDRPLTFLVITSTFPPRGGSSVQRVAKFCKYAKRMGAEPIVVTAKFDGGLLDETLLDDLPEDLEVHRVADSVLSKNKTLTKITRKLSKAFFLDENAEWRTAAIVEGIKITRSRQIDAIFVSYGSISALLAGAKISYIAKKPLFIDIRDLKNKNRFNRKRITSPRPFSSFRIDGIEKRIFNSANAFSVVSKGYHSILKNYYNINGKQISLIYNGYDTEDFFTLRDNVETSSDEKVIRYIGFITHPDSLHKLIEATAIINQRRRDEGLKDVHLEIVGSNNPSEYQRIIDRCSGKNWCSFLDYVDHSKAIKLMKSASALVLLQHAEAGVLTGKLFEYIGSGSPILLLNNNNIELSKVVNEYDLGEVASYQNVAGISKAIDKLMAHSSPYRSAADVQMFRRDYQATQFLNALYQMCKLQKS